jgi:hypothetical protein
MSGGKLQIAAASAVLPPNCPPGPAVTRRRERASAVRNGPAHTANRVAFQVVRPATPIRSGASLASPYSRSNLSLYRLHKLADRHPAVRRREPRNVKDPSQRLPDREAVVQRDALAGARTAESAFSITPLPDRPVGPRSPRRILPDQSGQAPGQFEASRPRHLGS